MVDLYTIGEVNRISPEAPVPILHVKEELKRAGGAGNAILNLISLGMEVVALGRIGEDAAGFSFLDEMEKENVNISAILRDPTFQTPLKNRVMAAGQQIVRVDYEQPSPLDGHQEQKIIETLPVLLADVHIVAISDYAKGFLTPNLIGAIIHHARQLEIPVVVDPKGMDFIRYQGATLIKPNVQEAKGAAGLGIEATLDQIAERILTDIAIDNLLITRSKEGISLFSSQKKREDFPAHVHEVKDVTGAGDTVLAVITAAMANQIPLCEAAVLANAAAGIAIERSGCARVSLSDLASRLAHQFLS